LVWEIIQQIKKLPISNFLKGLMTIGSIMESKNPEENVDFENLRQLRDDLSRHLGRSLELSMGMSSDYPIGTL
jgi:uncharacterized pyridoxal phosphate-containing UPF0001 family protein